MGTSTEDRIIPLYLDLLDGQRETPQAVDKYITGFLPENPLSFELTILLW